MNGDESQGFFTEEFLRRQDGGRSRSILDEIAAAMSASMYPMPSIASAAVPHPQMIGVSGMVTGAMPPMNPRGGVYAGQSRVLDPGRYGKYLDDSPTHNDDHAKRMEDLVKASGLQHSSFDK